MTACSHLRVSLFGLVVAFGVLVGGVASGAGVAIAAGGAVARAELPAGLFNYDDAVELGKRPSLAHTDVRDGYIRTASPVAVP